MTFKCRNMGLNCDYVARAESIPEVLEMVKAHSQEFHGDMLMNLISEDAEKLNKKIVLSISDNVVDTAPDDPDDEEDIETDEEEDEESSEYS